MARRSFATAASSNITHPKSQDEGGNPDVFRESGTLDHRRPGIPDENEVIVADLFSRDGRTLIGKRSASGIHRALNQAQEKARWGGGLGAQSSVRLVTLVDRGRGLDLLPLERNGKSGWQWCREGAGSGRKQIAAFKNNAFREEAPGADRRPRLGGPIALSRQFHQAIRTVGPRSLRLDHDRRKGVMGYRVLPCHGKHIDDLVTGSGKRRGSKQRKP